MPVFTSSPAVLAPVDTGLLKRVREILDRLPQRDLIRVEDYNSWSTEICRAFGELATWHAVRSGGFGGSQIGALVRNYAGYRADFGGSAHDIVALCLLRVFPDETSAQMQRGVENEAAHAQKFYAKYGVQRDEVAYEKLKNGVGRFPWMRYSPDDLVSYVRASGAEGSGSAEKQLWLIDYKAPSEVDASQSVAFQYVAQLHQGAMVCHANGVRVHAMMLSQFDWKNWCLKDDLIAFDSDLCQLIEKSGNFYWNEFVMKGQLPPYVKKPLIDVNGALREALDEKMTAYAMVRTISNKLDGFADELSANIKSEISQFRLAEAKVSFSHASVAASPKIDQEKLKDVLSMEEMSAFMVDTTASTYDPKKMSEKLKELGIPLAQFRSTTLALDEAKVFDALDQRGLDAEAFVQESLRINISKEFKRLSDAWVMTNIVEPNEQINQFFGVKPSLADPAECDRVGQVLEPGATRSFMEPGSSMP